MNRINYYWPRAATKITGILFLSQLLALAVTTRKPGFEWVLPLCGGLFVAALLWTLYAILVNAARGRASCKSE